MSTTLTPELAQSVADWVRTKAEAMQVVAKVNPKSVTQNGNWLDVPLSLNAGGDAYDRAMLLQQIEDAWTPETHGGLRLFLHSTGRTPTKEDDYTELGELMKRQHIILDRLGERGITPEDTEHYRIIRQNWEELLREMERRYPSLSYGVV